VPFADRIRREAGIVMAVVGCITEPTHADEIIRDGRADIVLLAREFVSEPCLATRALSHKDAVSGPVQYGRVW
jgi:NADPH2 dehydrogenase